MKGLIAGVISTLIGFGLTMVWDIFKFRREAKQREKSLLSAVMDDLASNLDILDRNQRLLRQELTVLEKGQSIVGPLFLLRSGTWDMLKINLPKRLASAPASLIRIREASKQTDEVNENIRSRENYRIHNNAMSNYNSHMKAYDEMLIDFDETLARELEGLKALLT